MPEQYPSAAEDLDLLELLLEPKTAEQGFRMLVERYQVRLYGHIRRLVGRHEDADDVLQNTFVKAYHGIDQFRGESRLYSWLFRIATNEALNFLQREQRRQTTPLGDQERSSPATRADPAMPGGTELRDLLDRAVATLPHKQRIVFDLRYFEEMPYAEMSRILDTSEGALKASYHHAVKKIEDYVRAHGETLLNH